VIGEEKQRLLDGEQPAVVALADDTHTADTAPGGGASADAVARSSRRLVGSIGRHGPEAHGRGCRPNCQA
jgi:hypothetical protein